MAAKHGRYWLGSIRLLAFDLATFFFCGLLASEVRFWDVPFPNFTIFDILVVLSACFLCLSIVGGYEAKRDMCSLRYASEHLLTMWAALTLAFITTYTFSSYNNSTKPGRSVLFLTIILFTPLSLLYRRLLSQRASREAATRSVYLICRPDLGTRLMKFCHEKRFPHPLRFIDFESWKKSKLADQPFWQQGGACEAIVVDFSGEPISARLEERLLEINLHAAPVYPVQSFVETYFDKIDLPHVNVSWALDGTFKADHHSAYGRIKAIGDAVVGSVLFVALLPLMLLIALLIRGADSGPALFRQVRVGRFNQPFVLYKFRTMTASAQENLSPYTQKNDPRITRIGRFLRLTRLDELPQLWNVVKGDMSMIGPRAEWDKLVEIYKSEIPFYHLRFMVKPGITGWAQVNYGYGASVEDALEKLQYDLYYIKHYSPRMDASIILKTLFTIFSASGR